jgi:hypothetical protein
VKTPGSLRRAAEGGWCEPRRHCDVRDTCERYFEFVLLVIALLDTRVYVPWRLRWRVFATSWVIGSAGDGAPDREGKFMYKHDFMKSRPREDSDVAGPGSHRRPIQDEEDDGDTNFVGRKQSFRRQPERRLVHVASLLRALQSAESVERQIAIVIETDEALMVAADPLLLTAAVGNLVYNAVTFSRDRGRVILRSRAVPEGISIEVEDECEGLHSGDPAALFSPLVCVDHREVASLWLAAAKRSAKALNGTLYVEHQVGVGCTFCLILPHAGHRAAAARLLHGAPIAERDSNPA